MFAVAQRKTPAGIVMSSLPSSFLPFWRGYIGALEHIRTYPNNMIDRDAAESSLASYRPDFAEGIDTPADKLRDIVAPFVPMDRRARVFAEIDAVLESIDSDSKASPEDEMRKIFEFLRAVFGDSRLPEDVRRRACATAIGANDPAFGKSYQHYADFFGVTRACVHADAREAQQRYGLHARRDKCPAAREKSRELASTRKPAITSAVAVKNARGALSFFPAL